MDAPFFIVASARSGTTFLRLTLNAHPRVAVPPESRFITELYRGSDDVQVASFLRALADHKRFKAWALPLDLVEAEIGERTQIPYPEAIACVYRAYARKEGKVLWGDKTPRYVEHIALLTKLFPKARFIHLVRDGRNVALSYGHVDFGPKTVAKAAELWSRRVSAGIRDGRALPADHYIEVRAEDLAADPPAEIAKVCTFLGIEPDPTMFDEEVRARGVVDKAKHNYAPAAAGRKKMSSWETDMAPADIEVFEAVAGDVLSELGYPRRYPAPSAPAKLRARLALLGLPLGRLRD